MEKWISIGALAALAVVIVVAVFSSGEKQPSPAPVLAPVADNELRPVEAFAVFKDDQTRSVALFQEAGKVITGPRCLNCHPAGNSPTQGDKMTLHQPLVVRGAADHGAPGMECSTCHHDTNFDPAGVPGHPHWGVAPIQMAWQGKTLGQICTQIKDRARNGGRDMDALVKHMSEDTLVGWAWHPGAGRTPAVGSQAAFGALIRAWADSGAACPQ